MNKKVLITGMAGFFGTNFWQWLNRAHPQIDCHGFDLVYGQDCRDYSQVEKAVRDKDVVFHLAAFTHTDTSFRYPDMFLQGNILGTLNMLKACSKHRVKLVYISSSEVYGRLREGWKKESEDHPFNPASPYATSKAMCDLMCQNWHKSFGADVVIVRPFNGYGFYQDRRKMISKFVERIEKGLPIQIYGSGEQTRDWNFATDIVRGIWKAQELPAGEIINLCSGKDYSVLEIVKLLKEIVDSEVEVEHIESRHGEVERMIGDNTKVKKLLDWEPQVEIKEGLRKTYHWIKENKPIAYLGGEPKTLRFLPNEGSC